jgi:RNA polymerase sigma factor (sigma-70 family)
MSNEYNQSITKILNKLKDGDESAVGALWDAYFGRLSDVARQCMNNMPRRTHDEEDVLVSVFISLWEGSGKHRWDELKDRNDLWRMLLKITHDKIVDRKRHATRQKRYTRSNGLSQSDELADLARIASDEPSPEFLFAMSEELNLLLDRLDSLRINALRSIVTLRLEGFTNREIAERIGITMRTVQRKLVLIQDQWNRI